MSDLICGTPPDSRPRLLAKDNLIQYVICCDGAYNRGAASCTCWVPEYDLPQQRLDLSKRPTTRSQMCGDCAYKPDSPERKADPYALVEMDTFYCHKGMRRPIRWRHPDGRVRDAYPGDYQPLFHNAVPYRADGTPAALCGGWARVQEQEKGEPMKVTACVDRHKKYGPAQMDDLALVPVRDPFEREIGRARLFVKDSELWAEMELPADHPPMLAILGFGFFVE